MKKELIGKKFGKLTVIAKAENKGKNTAFKCKCDCGKEKEILTYNLMSGKSKSCGCVTKEKLSNIMKTHGDSKSRLYRIYKGMKQRCNNKNNPAYMYYGGKGITICNEWKLDYLKFKEWSLKNGYNDFVSIDRINPNKNYSPENCRWVSMKKQQNNKLNSVFIMIGKEKFTIAEWAEMKQTNKQTLYSKLYRILEQLNIENDNVEGFVIKLKN